MSKPLLSVLLPTFNMGAYLVCAIDSILAQTFTDFELIVLDDGSADNTPAILADYAQRDSRIVAVTNEQNIGLIATLNKGLHLARGKYIARQDADNYSLPERFAAQVDYLEQNRQVGLVGTQVYVISEHGQTSRHSVYPAIVYPPALISWELLFSPYFAHDSIMARREKLLEVGGYRPNQLYVEDYDLWRRLKQVTELAMLPFVGGYLFYNPEGVSQRKQAAQDRAANQIRSEEMSGLLSQPVSLEEASVLGASGVGGWD